MMLRAVSRSTAPDLLAPSARRTVALLIAVAATAGSLLPAAASAEPTPGSTSAATPAEGSFVVNHDAVYRIAGGAPVFVSSWDAFGGEQPTTAVDDDRFAALPSVPANGTFLSGARRGEVYRVAGGAPVFVSAWDVFGGERPLVAVDDAAIDHAGEGGQWSHLQAVPADGTLIRGTADHANRIVYSGVARTTENQAAATVVDQAAITRAGSGGYWNHLRADPFATPTAAPSASASPAPSAPAATPTATPAPSAHPAPSAAAAAPPSRRVSVRHHGRAVGRGRLCLAETRSAVVRSDRTTAGTCVAVAKHGATTIRAVRPGAYFVVLLARARHVSATRVLVTTGTRDPVVWRL